MKLKQLSGHDTLGEGLFDSLVHGALLRAKAMFAGAPAGFLKNRGAKQLLATAAAFEGNLFRNQDWWQRLGQLIVSLGGAGDPQQLATAILHRVQAETKDWFLNATAKLRQQELANNQLKLQALHKQRQALGAIKKRRDAAAKRAEVKQRVAERRAAAQTARPAPPGGPINPGGAPSKPPSEGLEHVLAILAEGLWDRLKAGISGGLDLLNPIRRQSLGKGYLLRSFNKLVAALALKYAAEIVKGRRQPRSAPAPAPETTASSPDVGE